MVARRLFRQTFARQPEDAAAHATRRRRSTWPRTSAVRSPLSERSRPPKTLKPVMSRGSPPHASQDGRSEERRRSLDPLIEDQISIFVLPRRHPRGVGGHRQNFALVHETVERGIGGPDRLLGERIKLGRRGIEPHDRRRIVASQRVVDQDRRASRHRSRLAWR